ncbi:MAG: hypothetical protein ACXAC5_05250 [Promethearchaeota archaeon]|jgi:hypothetical protein
MKIRAGFVSNSSSSSFVAVGLGRKYGNKKNNDKFNEIVEKLAGCSVNDIGYETLEKIWYCNGICEKNGIWLYTSDAEPFFVGLDMEAHIKADKTFSEAKEKFKQLIKDKLGISVPIKSIELRIDESSSG